MRKELKYLQLIDRYLSGEMTAEDRATFEAKMEADPQLKADVEQQQLLTEAVQTNGLREAVKKAGKAYKWSKIAKFTGFVAVPIVAALAYGAIAMGLFSAPADNVTYATNELGQTEQWADADLYLPSQFFTVSTSTGQLIQGENGVTIAVPAGAFLDANGNPVTGQVELELKEAVTPEAILSSGLSTMSGDEMLETGGMFYLNARQNGENLRINPDQPLMAEIPTEEVKPGMQLFSGERKEDGSIDWVDPKTLNDDLVTVDILSLNFYPPGYESELIRLGKTKVDKSYKDSLFYSFAADMEPYTGSLDDALLGQSDTMSIYPMQMDDDTDYPEKYGINPATIQSIWQDDFQGTLLATQEFEERLSAIYRTCDPAVLDLYLNNLNLRLSTIDSMAARHIDETAYYGATDAATYNPFWDFSRQNKGRVRMVGDAWKLLAERAKLKANAYAKLAAEKQAEFTRTFQEIQGKASQIGRDIAYEEQRKAFENWQQEFQINLDETYRQLGLKKTSVRIGYVATVQTTGWKNIDQYVAEQTTNRETIDVTHNGRRAVIQYESWTATVEQAESYDRLLVYLLPDQLNSYQRVMPSENGFEENLNELINYHAVAIGYRGDDLFFNHVKDLTPGTQSIDLQPGNDEDLQTIMFSLNRGIQGANLGVELLERMNLQRLQSEVEVMQGSIAFRAAVKEVVLPCLPEPVLDDAWPTEENVQGEAAVIEDINM